MSAIPSGAERLRGYALALAERLWPGSPLARYFRGEVKKTELGPHFDIYSQYQSLAPCRRQAAVIRYAFEGMEASGLGWAELHDGNRLANECQDCDCPLKGVSAPKGDR